MMNKALTKAEIERIVEVMALCGFPIKEIALEIFGDENKTGQINRIYTQRRFGLVVSAGVNAMVTALLQAESRESGFTAGQVDYYAMKSSQVALERRREIQQQRRLSADEQERLLIRIEMARTLTEARGCVPEAVWEPRRREKNREIVENVADCGLQWLNSRRVIPQWAYDTGLRLRGDFNAAQVGGIAGVDPAKEAVDGGLPAGQKDNALDAMQRLTACRGAVYHAFGPVYCPPRVVASGARSALRSGRGDPVAVIHFPDEAEKRWSWVERVAIHGMQIRARETGDWKINGAWLTEALEPVAHVYRMAPGGTEISKRMATWGA